MPCRAVPVLVQAYVDPDLKVPSAIISFVLKVLGPFIYSTAKKLVATAFSGADKPLAQRLRQRPELYASVKERVAEHLAAQATAAAPREAHTA